MPMEKPSNWIETVAKVTSCAYEFARLSTLTMGLQTSRRFRITFEYYAHGRLYSGEFQSYRAIAQNTQLAIRYNPLRPEQNDRAITLGRGSAMLMATGAAFLFFYRSFGSRFFELVPDRNNSRRLYKFDTRLRQFPK